MVHRSGTAAQVVAVGNGCGDVSLGKESSLSQPSPQRKMAGHRRGEGASGAVGGVRTLPLRLKYFVLNPLRGFEAEQIGRFLQVTAGDDDG